jgi:hypothetical protein
MREMSLPPSDDEPCSKRAKVFRACSQCVSAKTRCEDIKSKGCFLCRRKRKTCSLTGAIVNDSSVFRNRAGSGLGGEPSSRRSSMHPPGVFNVGSPKDDYSMGGKPARKTHADGEADSLHRDEARIFEAERRISTLERELKEIRAAQPPIQYGHDGRQAVKRPECLATPRFGRIEDTVLHAQFEDFSETIFSLSTPDAFPSALSAGILQEGEVELAFQSFKHHFSPILPLTSFLSISTPSPTHNFVILACLHHVPHYASPQLAELVDKSILTALSGNITEDVVLALLILALAPMVPLGPEARLRPTPLRLISLAYQLGRDLGLEGKAERYLLRGADLAELHWEEAMQLVQMVSNIHVKLNPADPPQWSAVINRYIMWVYRPMVRGRRRAHPPVFIYYMGMAVLCHLPSPTGSQSLKILTYKGLPTTYWTSFC